jgi:NAD/NADP transhydrogenase beta subunit
MIIGAPSESYPGERRVALVPAVVANPLFAADNTLMLYGDAKQMGLDLVVALKNA